MAELNFKQELNCFEWKLNCLKGEFEWELSGTCSGLIAILGNKQLVINKLRFKTATSLLSVPNKGRAGLVALRRNTVYVRTDTDIAVHRHSCLVG